MHELSGPKADSLITSLLAQPETARFESKRVSGKMVGKALETICAFSNTTGGTLALGLEDLAKSTGMDRLYGLAENPETLDRVPEWVKAGQVIVSGFHSPLEQQVLRSALRRNGRVVKVLARGTTDYRPAPEEREPLAALLAERSSPERGGAIENGGSP